MYLERISSSLTFLSEKYILRFNCNRLNRLKEPSKPEAGGAQPLVKEIRLRRKITPGIRQNVLIGAYGILKFRCLWGYPELPLVSG